MMTRGQAQARSLMAGEVVRDRILLILLAFVMTCFGLLMIYSASSIMAVTSADSNYDQFYYVKRQAILACGGLAMALVASRMDYHAWARTLRTPIAVLSALLLALVLTPLAGADAYGATRWVAIGPIHLQPSEFSKAAIIACGASLMEDWMGGYVDDRRDFVLKLFGMIGLPLFMILMQPDKGTVLVVGITLVLMLYIAGVPLKLVGSVFFAAVLFIGVLAMLDDYSRRRILIVVNPWLDQFDRGYQLIQGLYAFGAGGLFGVGLGMSRQKYYYLPMAHNDFIYAVVGEELGLVGTLGVLAAFFLLVYLGFRIARNAPDLCGRLIAAGCVSLLAIQLLVNVSGLLCIIPLSGKPIPFLSYGGSSIMSTLLMIGMVVSVSRQAQVAAGASDYDAYEAFGPAPALSAPSGRLRVVQGGRSTSPRDIRAERGLQQSYGAGRITTNRNGSRRIDLGPSASDRLRRR